MLCDYSEQISYLYNIAPLRLHRLDLLRHETVRGLPIKKSRAGEKDSGGIGRQEKKQIKVKGRREKQKKRLGRRWKKQREAKEAKEGKKSG